MEQMPLFGEGELVPVREFLHVWNEAERAQRLNKKTADRLPRKIDGCKVVVMRLSSEGHQSCSGKYPNESGEASHAIAATGKPG
jgi:hypothetical protein